MRSSAVVDRVIIVVLDGLRPDAVATFGLDHLAALAARSAHTYAARTVTPSVTACAMSSLFTGASPERHGMRSDKFGVPRPTGQIDPLPKVLATHGLTATAHMAQLPWLYRGLGRKIASMLGVQYAGFHGHYCTSILEGALPTIRARSTALTLMHWPDADRAGHKHAWMSREYGIAARRMDSALGALVREVEGDEGTLLIALADHGGGAVNPKHHMSDHPTDHTIPLVIAGPRVTPGVLPTGVSLLDVPPTALWALGIDIPESYAGQPIRAAFARALAAA
jgi:predicted AlkP superfamily pyrophosphatase or phosphodiesterase